MLRGMFRGLLRLGSFGALRDRTLCTGSNGGGSEDARSGRSWSFGSWEQWIGHINKSYTTNDNRKDEL